MAQFQPGSTATPSVDGVDLISSQNGSTESRNPKEIALNNVEVFFAADKFGIGPLKFLATRKFQQCLDKHWYSAIFPEVIRESIEMTPSHLQDLKVVMAKVIPEHILDLIKNQTSSFLMIQGTDDILGVLDSFGCLGSLVILHLISSKRVKGPDEDDRLQTLVQKLNSTKNCQHCLAGFNVALRYGEYQDITIRCIVCKTRYY